MKVSFNVQIKKKKLVKIMSTRCLAKKKSNVSIEIFSPYSMLISKFSFIIKSFHSLFFCLFSVMNNLFIDN